MLIFRHHIASQTEKTKRITKKHNDDIFILEHNGLNFSKMRKELGLDKTLAEELHIGRMSRLVSPQRLHYKIT